MDLTIGDLGKPLDRLVSEAVQRLGITSSLVASAKDGQGPKTISLLNLASVILFTDYVSRLEGFRDSAEALERTQFRNLPWWMVNVWLPIRFEPPFEPIVKDGDWPVFLGSSCGLLDELVSIQRLAKPHVDFGAASSEYEQMRSDLRAFYKSSIEIVNEAEILQWVWRGLFDAAEMSMRQGLPMVGTDS